MGNLVALEGEGRWEGRGGAYEENFVTSSVTQLVE